MPPTRLALLVCDTPIPSVLSNYGSYHSIFHSLLQDSYPGKKSGVNSKLALSTSSLSSPVSTAPATPTIPSPPPPTPRTPAPTSPIDTHTRPVIRAPADTHTRPIFTAAYKRRGQQTAVAPYVRERVAAKVGIEELVAELDTHTLPIRKGILMPASPVVEARKVEGEGEEEWVLEAFDVVKGEYPDEETLGGYKGLLISGSAASAYENVEWINKLTEFVARVARTKPEVKIIGICFGHQIIARALSGTVVPNNGIWEVGPTKVELNEVGKELFGVSAFTIEQFHRDHVPSVPSPFLPIGSTPVCANQGMVLFYEDGRGVLGPAANGAANGTVNGSAVNGGAVKGPRSLKDVQILTLQGHPEFTDGIVEHIVEARVSVGVLDKPTAEDVRRRIGEKWANDGRGVVGRVVWGVLGFEG
ncbi:hypothetical protein JAAARDRAFT_40737 [Jaapia argillacea MUCL 33604]|uniref:Glutamine amidotransferase domain-containing protein n=1 Tax=Jaapia argillacea MUCL 33604 TaxID=933084 RepID=A0A067PLL8_9AGAM|nr:hypothetical protein JAAARDRAFT_40737 [Jaapia argillacea MUCL 33604]